jgi:Hemolysin-coregulated protein (uncharacterized)
MLYFVEFSSPISDFCEVNRCTFGYKNGPSAGGASHVAQRNDMSFTKESDSFSGKLMQHCANGTKFSTVSVELYQDAESDVYMIYKLSDVIISSMHTGKADAVGLSYKAMKQTYYGG